MIKNQILMQYIDMINCQGILTVQNEGSKEVQRNL